jgi:phosphatidyl-myo-inositol dimannoside synthase
MERKRIIILSEDFPPHTGGIAQWAAGVAQSFHVSGHEVVVVTRFWERYKNIPTVNYGFKVNYIQKKNWKRLRTLYWRAILKKLLAKDYPPDLIIATTWNAARGIMSIGKKRGLKVAIPVYGLEITRKMNFMKKWWCTTTLRNADHLIAISRFTRDRLAAFIGIAPEKILTVPCGVAISRFNPTPLNEELKKRFGLKNEKIVLTLSRVVERKGHDMVIRALPSVLREVPDAKYIVAGDPSGTFTDTLKKLARELGVENNVVFAGRLEPDEIVTFYNLCDVYIMPSREIAGKGDTEGFGITFLEANACGKPVIGGNSGGVADAIEDGVSGYLVDPLDTDDIANKLILLLKDEALAKKLGQQGRARILQGFTWDAIGDEILSRIFPE